MSTDLPHSNIQGAVISALLRLTHGSRDPDVHDLILRATARLIAPLERGGTCSMLHGGLWLEEFPRDPPGHVLGGCLTGLFGLYDAADSIGSVEARSTAVAIESTIELHLKLFVAPNDWSYYALNVYGHTPLNSVHYHRRLIAICTALAMRTNSSEVFATVARWKRSYARIQTRVLMGRCKSLQVVYMRGIRQLPLHGVGDG